MTQEDKNLLLKDLCARLPYKVKCIAMVEGENATEIITLTGIVIERFNEWIITEIKPYLRPMSSMTEEERKEYDKFYFVAPGQHLAVFRKNCERRTDWLNAHHFDYRGLISIGLALEAPEGMYKTE